jgi:CRISPR type I-D-associated protein Csc2
MDTKVLSDIARKAGAPDGFFRDLSVGGYKNQPSERYAHFVILEELQDYALFTQDGQTIVAKDTMDVPNGTERVTRGVQFIRKITAALRRKSKSILRTHAPDVVKIDDEGNTAGMQSMGKYDPDDALFGFAVGEEGAVKGVAFAGKSRVKTGSSFTIRPISNEVAQYINFNAQSDDTRIAKPSTALGEKEFFLPETIFPSVITLQDPCVEDVAYLLHVIAKTGRMGAVSSRNGKVTMHVVAVIFNHEELPSNLSISQWIYAKAGMPSILPPVATLKKLAADAVVDLCKSSRINHGAIVTGEVVLDALFSTVFKTEESTSKWIATYANKYQMILVQSDLVNAPEKDKKNKEYLARVEEVKGIVAACEQRIAALK